MREIDGDLLFGDVNHNNLTHATAKLAGGLITDSFRSSEDPWIASMDVVSVPEAAVGGGFGLRLDTTTGYDVAVLEEIAGSSCRGLTVRLAGSTALHTSVEGVVEALRTGQMSQSA